jgi:C-terminal processing protease CtpA/Prc
LHFALVGDSIGYLRIDWFPLHCDNALDQIFREASELKGLIIDERLNTGGYDSFGLALASRLTSHEYLAYSKVARNDVIDNGGRTAPQRITVRPSSRPGFSGQVALLTGHDSVSEAEVFAMALFGREPAVTRIGEETQGVFSDVMERSFPNGWYFRLPNEVYLAEDGRAYDVSGVPPDVRVPVFSEPDLKDGRDSALEKAIEVLGRTRK